MIAEAGGRRAHMPLADGISPTKGGDTNGPTSVVISCAKMDQRHTGGCLLNQKFTPAALAGQKGIDNLAALILTAYMEAAYDYCKRHEAEIRQHIRQSENRTK